MSLPEYIGPYRVLRSIASGGMAEVFEVQDPASEERYALKLLQASIALKRFNREYEAMTRLNHPGIVRVYHYGLHEGKPWLTMELVRGTPAQTHLKEQSGTAPDRMREALRIAYLLSNALSYVHDRGLVHRDLKSANVLVLADQRVKLIDFGTAHLTDPLERLTADGEFVGTYAYASPEQILGKPVDARADLYSLGVLLFRLVTGRRPFPGNDPTELAIAHTKGPVPDPRKVMPSLDPRVAELITSLLAKKPDGRPESAAEVARRVEEFAGTPFSARGRLAVHLNDVVVRDRERRAALEHLSRSEPGDLVVVAGDEGSDRARTTLKIGTDVTAAGWVSWTMMMAAGGEDVEPINDALERLAIGLPDVAGALDTVRRCAAPDALARPQQRLAWLQAGLALVLARAQAGRLLLVIPEVHQSGPLGAALLGAIRKGVQEARAPVAFVVSAPGAVVGAASDVGRWLRDGWLLHLDPLTPRGVAVAVGTMLGRRPPPAELSRRLHAATGGQPLYLEESVSHLVEQGNLEADGNRLEWADATVEVEVPDGAVEDAEEALGRLPVCHRRALEVLAFLEDAQDLDALAGGLGWDADEVQHVVKALVAGGFLDSQYGWRMPIARSRVLNQMHVGRRVAIARALVPVLSTRTPTRALVTALLVTDRVDQAVRIAARLVSRLAVARNLRLLLDILEPIIARASEAVPSRHLAELHLAFAQAVQGVRPTDPSAARSLQAARRLAGDDPRFMADVALTTSRWQAVIGHYRNYGKHLQEAWESLGAGHGIMQATVALEMGKAHLLQGSLQSAESWFTRAQGISFDDGNLQLAGAALAGTAACQLGSGSIESAEETASHALQSCEKAEDRPGLWYGVAHWAAILRRQGRFSEALGALYQRLPEASQWPDPGPYLALLLATAWCEIDLARLGKAQECVDELAATLHRGEHLHLRLESALVSGYILLRSGQPREALYVVQDVAERAGLAELSLIAHRARAIVGRVVYELGDEQEGGNLMLSAILGLQGLGDQMALADAVVQRASTLAGDKYPGDLFKPVEKLVQTRGLPLLRLEYLLASMTFYLVNGDRERGRAAIREAATVLNRVATSLNDTDRAAIRVHPWSQSIREALAAVAVMSADVR
jgi:tetratricopeptide (TPR) repeat protein